MTCAYRRVFVRDWINLLDGETRPLLQVDGFAGGQTSILVELGPQQLPIKMHIFQIGLGSMFLKIAGDFLQFVENSYISSTYIINYLYFAVIVGSSFYSDPIYITTTPDCMMRIQVGLSLRIRMLGIQTDRIRSIGMRMQRVTHYGIQIRPDIL